MALYLAVECVRKPRQLQEGEVGKASKKDVLRGQAMGRNIWKPAIGEVGESAEVFFGSCADVVIQVGGYRGRLVLRAREVIAEASGAGDPGDLGLDRLSTADCGDVRTCAWELRRKLWCLFAVVGLTGCTDACGVG